MLSNTAYYWNGMLECDDDCEDDCKECHREISKSFEDAMGKKPEITDVFQLGFYVDFKNEVNRQDGE